MTTHQAKLQTLVNDFITSISLLQKEAMIEMISTGSGPMPMARGGGLSKGEKRPAAELDALAEKFLAFVSKKPGLRIEQVNRELETTTKALALPIRKLIAEKKIKTRGQKRATVYFAT